LANEFPLISKQIVIFGGKGGVGKTTAAAAFALALARAERKKKVLIFSTDPAHSLSDSFGEEIGRLKSGVAGNKNLHAMEIDPGEWFEELKQRYRTWTDELFRSLTGSSRMEIKFDREAMRELVELTPPGIDEIAALGAISDLLDEDAYDSLKYQNVVKATQVAEELVALSKSIKRVVALLTDRERCEFVGVAIPERMSLEETVDLAKALEKLDVSMEKLLINGLIPEAAAGKCDFCKSRREMQDQVVTEFRRKFRSRSVELFFALQQPHEIVGMQALLGHFQTWDRVQSRVQPR
jgi:arsenite-transporting ATPase